MALWPQVLYSASVLSTVEWIADIGLLDGDGQGGHVAVRSFYTPNI